MVKMSPWEKHSKYSSLLICSQDWWLELFCSLLQYPLGLYMLCPSSRLLAQDIGKTCQNITRHISGKDVTLHTCTVSQESRHTTFLLNNIKKNLSALIFFFFNFVGILLTFDCLVRFQKVRWPFLSVYASALKSCFLFNSFYRLPSYKIHCSKIHLLLKLM